MRSFDEEVVRPRTARPVQRHTDEPPAGAAGPLNPAAMLDLQRVAGNATVSSLVGEQADERSPVLDVVGRGGGQALDAGVRGEMEERFGEDFGDVRVHTGPEAAASAQSVNAHAYTVSNEIVFGDHGYAPGTDEGKRTLAHELTHVVQQRSGPVDGTPTAGGIALSDPSDRFEREAEQHAERVVSGEAVAPASAVSGAGSVQRQATGEEEEEEEAVQGSFVQRQEADEEEKKYEEEAPSGG